MTAAGAPLGSIFGNILSGFIAEYADWKWVFGVSAIMAGLISVAGIFVIPKPPTSVLIAQKKSGPKSVSQIDWLGAVLVTVGLLSLLIPLTEGNVVGWSTPWVPFCIVLSLLFLATFVYWQHFIETRRPQQAPLVKVSMFRDLRFSAVILIMGMFFASFNNFLIFATYFYQNFQGLSPLKTALRFIPTGVAGALVALIVAKILDRVPTVFLLTCGNVSISIACLLFAVPISPSASYFAWGLPAMVLSVIGADTTWPALTLYISRSLPPEDQAIGGALGNAVGQLGRAIGLALSTAVQTAVMANARGVSVSKSGGLESWDDPTLKGIRAGNWLNFGFGLASLFFVPMAFRSLEIIGKVEPPENPLAGGGEEGIMDEEYVGKINDRK